MSHWDYKTGRVIRWETVEREEYPGWEIIDCWCCNGLEWGGEVPIECERCKGGGTLFHHKKSGVLAEYPGGPFLGRM